MSMLDSAQEARTNLIEMLGFSQFVHEKAERLSPRRVGVDLWEIEGDNGTYRVRYDKHFEATGQLGWFTCSCPAGDRSLSATCSHGLSVIKAVMAEERSAIRVTSPSICTCCGRYAGRDGRFHLPTCHKEK